MTLTQLAFVAFAAVASGGLLMCGLIAAKRGIPAFLSAGHGLAGLACLGLLLAANLQGGDATPALAWWALAVFTGGMIGGLVLFRVLFKHKAPLWLAAVHGSVGALGLWLLFPVTGF